MKHSGPGFVSLHRGHPTDTLHTHTHTHTRTHTHAHALHIEWDYKLQRVYICQSVRQLVLTLWFATRVFILSNPPYLLRGCLSMGTVRMYLKVSFRFPTGNGLGESTQSLLAVMNSSSANEAVQISRVWAEHSNAFLLKMNSATTEPNM